jgi:photosystem II stability/assembly factor-like uncharacterized protein
MLKYRSNGSLFECNDGGVYLSSDNGTTWADKTNGLVISQMYKLGVAETDQNEIITGLQDNGTKLFSGGNWYDVKGGDGMECLIDYADADVQYGTYVNGQISRTLDHWNSDTDIEPSGAGSGAWVTPFIIDPMNSQTLFAGYADVWKTANRGDSWTKISTINTSNKIRSMAIAPSDNRYLYVADYSHIWKTTIGGNTWTDITGTLPVGTNSITYIAVKYDDPNTLWVTLSAYNSNKVYQSADGGITWTNISAGLPSIPAYTIVQNKQSTSEVHLYVGTEVGVYFKKGSDNWIPYNTGLPNVKFGELEIYYSTNPENSKLRAATYGRGLWETSVYYNNTNPPLADFTVSSSSVCLSNPVGLNDFSSGSPSSWEWTITPSTFVFIGGTSSSSQNPLIQPTAFGYYTIKLKVTNSYGADSITKNNIIYVENSITTGISSVLLGSSTNAFSVVNNTSKQLIYNPSTNLLAFIHRNNQSLFGGNSGQLRYDFSIDTGSTWLCNAGPLNPTTTYQARYPQLSFYNPTGNTNYLNSYLVYHAPVLNPAWKGYVGGVRKMNGTGTTENYNQAGTANTLIPGGLHQSISGTYWAIDNIYDSAAANELGYKVIKGVWSGSNITWSNSYSILPSFDVNYNGKNHTTSLAIDFSLDGQIGYMIFLAHLSGTTSYYQYSPVYYKTTNGGNTWIGPYYIDLNSLPEITSFVPAGYFPDAGWQVDVAVDYNNHPHFFIGAHYGDGLSYSIFHPTVLFDITTVDDVNFIANEISRPKTWLTEFVDTYSYNQLQICTTPDKKNIFFSWIDTDTLGGNWMNNAPDLFVRGYNAELKSFSNIKSVTRCTSISGEIFFPKISKTAIVSNNIIQIPAVYTTFSTPFDPNYRVDYNYIKGIKFNKCELYPFPNPVVTPTNSIICQGDSALLNSTSTTGCNVAWFKDNNLILGANTYQYYAKSTGQYNTKETSICYSNISSNIVNVNANPTPATPVVSQISNYLHSTATTGNQWYFNNVLLPSETGQNYTPTQNGNYFVIVTSADNCVSDTSNIFNFVMSGIGELSNKFFIKVYPNPVGNEFKIDLEGNNETLSFEIYNSVGTLVLKSTIKNKAIVQSINFPAGVYMLKLFDETFLELIKVVKK